jgi:hypothetical protein
MPVSRMMDLLQEALALHRRGAVAEAAARYTEVLRADPTNADAHYYLGMMASIAKPLVLRLPNMVSMVQRWR